MLNRDTKKILIDLTMRRFDISIESAKSMMDDLEINISGESEKFLHDLNYKIFTIDDIEFTRNSMYYIIDTFTILLDKAEDANAKKRLDTIFIRFLDLLFIERYNYVKNTESRADAAQKILLHTSKRLSETLETQELMIANISHEMRTSLNAIYGYLTLMIEKDNIRGEEKHFLQKANRATSTLKALVSDILHITKINSGQLEMKKEYFWLDELILKCIETVSMELKKKQEITLKTDIEFISTKIYGYQTHILEIVINLLSNAVKYTDTGFIKLKLKYKAADSTHARIEFIVEDSGIGMTSDQLENIFSAYSRFKLDRQGLGLGLHIAKELSKKMNGELLVQSEYGKGSRFTFGVDIEIDQNSNINIEGKKMTFLTNGKRSNMFNQKIDFLEKSGAIVNLFEDESELINFLLTTKKYIPDIVSIDSKRSGYAKIDAIIYYLKTLSSYKNTIFIAKNTKEHLSLRYFDSNYEFFTPMVAYSHGQKQKQNFKKDTQVDISILAVDDMESNLEILKMFIKKKYPNITVDLANGGYEAIGMFKVKKYDLILLDLKMPNMNGFQTFERLKEHENLPTVYAFTADVYRSSYEKVFEVGFSGILEKPLQPKKLYNVIQEVIDE